VGRTEDARPDSELGYAQRFQCGECGQTANLDASDPKYGNVAHHTPEGVQAQQRYVKGLLVHVNQYTKLSYKNDPDILAFEINNEPSHTNNVQEVKDYLNKMTTAMREAGLKKPIFYNMSHNFGVTDAFLTSECGLVSDSFCRPPGLQEQGEIDL
jgi:hypothetical protein